jgi:hypothetical protein
MQNYDKRILAFVDEYGNLDMETDKDGVTQLYIPVAVIIHEDVREQEAAKLRAIQEKYFFG